jgi:hypothetical protein
VRKSPLLLGDYYLTSLIMIALMKLANCDLYHNICCYSILAYEGLAIFKQKRICFQEKSVFISIQLDLNIEAMFNNRNLSSCGVLYL